jgi:FMN hydrolase / 5-amino-6-(5-phospho-D-ribitylamino)uracil phosphatase
VITIYFDGDQTLWDFQALMRRTVGLTIEQLRRLVPDLDGDLSVDAFVIDRERASEALRGTTTNLDAIRLAAFHESLRRLGVDDDDLAQHLNAFYLERRFSSVGLYDDVIPTLNDLVADYNIGLLSNGNSYPEGVGLERYFGAAVFSQDVGAEKPDPAIYLAAQNALPGDRYIMVGDSLTNDVTGAQSAGWSGVWLNRDGVPQPSFVSPDLTISTLHQLQPWLYRSR